jgi:hypothetical protein
MNTPSTSSMSISFPSNLTAVKRSEMDQAIDLVGHALASLKSCREWERENERRIVFSSANRLASICLKRRNEMVEARKISMLSRVMSEAA